MAKKKKPKCGDPNCLPCKWWPKVVGSMGPNAGCYWVDEQTGEVFVATGMRAVPGQSLVTIPEEESPGFAKVLCACGAVGPARTDLIKQGRMTMCPDCAANKSHAIRN